MEENNTNQIDRINKLVKIILDNPGMPVIPLVSSSLIEDYAEEHYYAVAGQFDQPFISEYCYYDNGSETILCVKDFAGDSNYCMQHYSEMKWSKAIFVFISRKMDFGSIGIENLSS